MRVGIGFVAALGLSGLSVCSSFASPKNLHRTQRTVVNGFFDRKEPEASKGKMSEKDKQMAAQKAMLEQRKKALGGRKLNNVLREQGVGDRMAGASNKISTLRGQGRVPAKAVEKADKRVSE